MDSDDEEMCDAASSAPSSPAAGGGVGEGEEEEGGVDDGRRGSEGVVIMEVTWFQVDLDYEFDAPRWFDLAQEEAPLDAAAAQEWFTSAPSYPPSPLIAKMLAEDLGLQTIRSIADTDDLHCSTASHECSSGMGPKIRQLEVKIGRKACNGASENERRSHYQTTMKGNSLRGSTLMKPTASQLAKQNRPAQLKNLTQNKKSVGVIRERSTISSNDCNYQSTKRQRLENGHLNKAAATAIQHEFIHKNHEKNVMNQNMDQPTVLPRLKITIPRSPDLATKLRAERSKAQRAVPTLPKQLNDLIQRVAPSAPTVQVAPTRKVVQPFWATGHQHASRQHEDVGSNVAACTSNHARHLKSSVDNKTEDTRHGLFKFKARPLDRKMLENKGDGVFRCAKRNTTVPKEFNLSTGRKANPAPLSELFNKLSLTAGAHQNRGVGRQIRDLPNYITTKDCKENMIGNMHR
ncbi:Cell cycle regulated microtubule associated protein [Zea mays]|uniref:Cell cycle regulated microtubule associated protein n=2 Tax=Zea mays TaxID=4577 RepID=A0A1D6NW52_MAIZE|nr:Cell cycle regulated microtubule associated protein [Zea mays]